MPRSALLVGLCILVTPAAALADLSADQLLLIVNRNVPESRELARFYQQARQVPDGRILELDLPDRDRMSRAMYEQRVVPEVRRFLEENALRDDVQCAVTFYGIPLVVEAKKLTEQEQQERSEVDLEAAAVVERFAPLVREAERIVHSVGYRPPPWVQREVSRIEVLVARLSAAEQFLAGGARLTEEQRRDISSRIGALRQQMDAPFEPDPSVGGSPSEISQLLARTDSEGRRMARKTLRARAPLANYAELLLQHQRLLSEEQSDACFDSELAVLWIDNAPASGWLANTLANVSQQRRQGPRILMTSRLDGRDPAQVRELIETCLRVEQAGLVGKIVIDSRGLAPTDGDGNPNGYGVFDEQLRALATLLRQHATLPVVHDDLEAVIQPPGEQDVAVYVGWYSLTKYVPAFQFADGAVGFHVASFEMRSLRDPRLPGWVRGLLDDGVVATAGPVSEPYLTAFPPPEEFFPLLLTGELTLAEVYWRTVPLVSWKMGLIGDPLYRPFAAHPALPTQALPPPQRLKL